LLINGGLFLAMMVFASKMGWGNGSEMDGRVLYAFGAKYREAILAGEWWRLITAGFLHGGFLHILMNSYALFIVGSQVEQDYGANRYIVFYIFTTLTGFLASFYWTAAISVGASAGIFGLMGAMIVLGMREKSAYGNAIRNQYLLWAGLSFALAAFGDLAIDNAAHIGGLAGGLAIGYVAGTPRYNRTVEQVWRGLAIGAVAVTVFCVGKWFLWLMANMSAIEGIR
jgi:rhomboid protease GluP